jgi:ribosomal protein L16 Arg81 hydroxylase
MKTEIEMPDKTETTDNNYSFDWLMNPVSKKEFFEAYFEQKHVHIKRSDSNYYSKLLTLESIEHFLYSQVVRFPAVRMTKSKEEIPADKYVMGDRVIPSQVIKYFSEGATLILAGLQEYMADLGLFCSFLTKEFGHKFQTNIYITPKHSQGFNVHYDTHDVFVMQVKGRKKWRLYSENPLVLPNKLQEFEKGKYTHGPLSHELILNEGDLLYIPRGVMHDADTMDEMSIHITTGMLGFTWTDMLVEGILDLSKKDPELRKFIPCDLMTGVKNAADYSKEIEQVFNRLKDQLVVDEIRGRMKKELLKNQRNNLSGMLSTAMKIDGINAQTSFSVRQGVIVSVTAKDENVVLEWLGKKVELPVYTMPAISFLSTDTPAAFTWADLPECMDEAGTLALLKRLTKEGYLLIN